MDVSKSEPSKNGAVQRECGGCGEVITERYLLKVLDMFWHEDCLKCNSCNCRLVEAGPSLFIKSNLILCKKDYLKLFGHTGHCAACNKTIPAFEMVMRARTNVYHLECFACQQCNYRFCIGDKFFLCENKILCESDYEERLVFANMAVHPPSTATLAHIKRQVIHLQPQNRFCQGAACNSGVANPCDSISTHHIMSPSPQRSVNGETTHNHNGYAAPASSSAHNILTSMNNLNGINAQTPYDTK